MRTDELVTLFTFAAYVVVASGVTLSVHDPVAVVVVVEVAAECASVGRPIS